MSRVSVLATAAIAVAVVVSGSYGVQLVSDDPGVNLGGSPDVTLTAVPTSLVLRESGSIKLSVSPPAAPGDTVYLNTAGAYDTGYVRVAEAVLDKHLRATVEVPGRQFLGTFTYWVSIPASGTYQEGTSEHFPIEIVSPAPQHDPSCGGVRPKKANGVVWRCTFDDEFNSEHLNRRYWVPQRTEDSGFTTGTKLKYACALDDPSTVAVHGGALELSLIELPESRDCGTNKSSKYVYGQVMHHQTYSQTYGKYEVRAKIPDLRVPGSQQSFWLWADKQTYGPWPASGEIDFAEMYSSTPGIDKPFIHYLPGESPDGTNQNITHANCPINVGEYNTYGLEWEPGKLTLLLNGKVCFIDEYSTIIAGPGSPAPFDQPFYLALNQAMGTIGNDYNQDEVPDRITTQIDYVRIWN